MMLCQRLDKGLLLSGLGTVPFAIAASPLASLAQSESTPPNTSSQGMVTAAHPQATQVGLAILQAGGNAVDAAVATTLAISVVEPFSAGIGGGGFLLYAPAQSTSITALDFREKAPRQATPNLYLDDQGQVKPRASRDGHGAVAVPGTVAGLAAVHRRYGKQPWKQLVQPAIRLAQRGFPVSDRLHEAIQQRQSMLATNPAAAAIFLPDGQPPQVGTLLKQPDLGRTLKAIATQPESFYTGAISQAIVRDMTANSGLIDRVDLQTYRPTWREPICGPFRQYRVCAMPPPSSGGVHLLQLLNLWQAKPFPDPPRFAPNTLHYMAESMKIAYADRAVHLGDPGFVIVPMTELVSPEYGRWRSRAISRQQARPADQVKAAPLSLLRWLNYQSESTETSHLNVVDRDRNAVSLTFTVNLGFGAGVVAEGTGIVLNNEMDDFAAAPRVPNAFELVGSKANAIAPGKIPLSSMSPTIVTEDGQLRLMLGAPGGSTIITTVYQLLLNTLVYRQTVSEAIAAPRLHHQWQPDQLTLEKDQFASATQQTLQRMGHKLTERSPWGNASLIQVLPNRTLTGAADPRGEGTALGY